MTHTDSVLRARASLNTYGKNDAKDVAEYERIKAALNQEALDNWHNDQWHREQAKIISEHVDMGFASESLFPTWFDTAQVGEFDVFSISERRGLQVFWTARGGYVDETQLQDERFDIPRDSVAFHVSEFEPKMRAGYADALESIVGLAEQRLEAELNAKVFGTLQEAVPSSSPFYVNATTGITAAALNSALRGVNDTVRPNAGQIPPVTIIGRAAAIDALNDIVSLNNEVATEEIRRRGMIGTYRGANVVRLANYTDANDVSYIPENELWIMSANVGKFVRYGGARTASWTENTVEYRHYQLRQDLGCAVFRPQMARRIVDGTI